MQRTFPNATHLPFNTRSVDIRDADAGCIRSYSWPMEPWGAALYGDPCRECGFDWSLTPLDAVTWVRVFETRIREAVGSLTGDERLEGWSVSQYVSHVGDNLHQWAERVQAARLAGQTQVAGYDPDTLATARGYEFIPLAVALWSAGKAAERWVEVLTAAVNEGVELEHATRGRQRAEDIARNNCHDACHHVWDIERIAAERLGPVVP